jgi:hypothetical protein
MVVNCVPGPVKRAEMLVRCRDHLKAGGLLFLALPSRCIDMSQHITRPMLERLVGILGFDTLGEKRTPRISFYTLRRRNDGAASAASAAPGQAPAVPEAAAPAAHAAKAGTKRKRGGEDFAVASGWTPTVYASDDDARWLADRLGHDPPRVLPRSELPVTGFTLTDFGITVPQAWVRLASGG